MKTARATGDAIASAERAAPLKVCMHVLNHTRSDVRAQRAASSLAAVGFTVIMVDIQGKEEAVLPEEDASGILAQRLIVPQWFVATRFTRWAMVRAIWLLALGVVQLVRIQADVYHALDLPALPACYIAGRLRRKPVVFESYELPLATLPASAMSRGRRGLQRLMAPWLKRVLPRCSGVITVSPPIVDEFHQRYRCADVALVRNIPAYQSAGRSDRLRQLLRLGPKSRIALYQGYLQANRSLGLLIRAATFLDPGTVIVMMGESDGTTREDLEALIAAEGVGERVKILPPVPYDELLDWTASADIGLIVYDPAYVRNVEAMLPNKFFEYLMAGLPVLSSPLPSVGEIIGTCHVGRVIASQAPQGIAAAINDMLANREALTEMRASALRIAREEFNWEKESQRLLDLYRRILKGRYEGVIQSPG